MHGRILYASIILVFYVVVGYSYLRISSTQRIQRRKSIPLYGQCVDAENALNWMKSKIDDIAIFKDIKHDLNLTIAEIGGGNTNFNYVIRDTNTNAAIFVKHAKPYAKGFGESAPMSTERLRYEFNGMNETGKFGFIIPECFIYDPVNHYICTSFLDEYEPFLIQLQNYEINFEIAQAIGGLLGHEHAGTHRAVLPTHTILKYINTYKNEEHFNLWDRHFFPMSYQRLKDLSLYKQTPDVAPFGEAHYKWVGEYIAEIRKMDNTCSSSCFITRAIEKVNDIYMHKKNTLIHGDLHSSNIMTIKELSKRNYDLYTDPIHHNIKLACSLDTVRLIDFEKFAYGPAGLDVAQYIVNYIYFMARVPTTSLVYKQYEGAIRIFWQSYIEAFHIHAETQCRISDIIMPRKTQDNIIHDILLDTIGFIGWWMFSLVANCPVDVMPLYANYNININDIKLPNCNIKPYNIEKSRQNHLKIAIEILRLYSLERDFHDIEEVLTVIRNSMNMV